MEAPDLPGTSRMPSRQEFDRLHQTTAPGDHYGIEFPFSVATLSEFGPDFLWGVATAAY